jgi:hypothetical protein
MPANLESVLCDHLVALAGRGELLARIVEQAFIDIDSLLRPGVWACQAGRLLRAHQDRRQAGAAQRAFPAGHHDQHRAHRAGDCRDAATSGQNRLGQRYPTNGRPSDRHRARRRATGNILVRGNSAYGTRAVVRACLRGKVQFSLVMSQNQVIRRAIDSIAADQWTPVRYPNAVHDPDTGAWISDAEVAEVP